jgi:pimeloyl-ACP methyl ester carboxylesterase
MPHVSTLSSRNSTNVRLAFETAGRRLALRASSALAPDLAAAWAERLFLTPPRPRFPEGAVYDLIDARSRFIEHRGRMIATWSWGSRDAPAVLLAHGWGGAARQMRGFVFPLTSAGLRVVAFDQPAHGLSGGRLTALPDFAEVLAEVAEEHGASYGVIGHSLGAAAAALAVTRGLRFARSVLISPPADVLGYSRRFARWHWLPERARRAMQAAIEERYGVRWAELDIEHLAPRLAGDALVIHDRRDRMVSFEQGARVARLWPGARLFATEGLGHSRMLEAEAIARAAADFIAGRSAIASPAVPALADPAPLY